MTPHMKHTFFAAAALIAVLSCCTRALAYDVTLDNASYILVRPITHTSERIPIYLYIGIYTHTNCILPCTYIPPELSLCTRSHVPTDADNRFLSLIRTPLCVVHVYTHRHRMYTYVCICDMYVLEHRPTRRARMRTSARSCGFHQTRSST